MKKENIKGYEYFEEYKDNSQMSVVTVYGTINIDDIYDYMKKNKHLDKSVEFKHQVLPR